MTPTGSSIEEGSLEVTVAGRPGSQSVTSLFNRARAQPAPAAAVLRYMWLLADGDRPRLTSELTRRILWRHPKTYRQKMLYKLSRDRRPLITTFADKVAVREYVASTIGSEVLKRVYAVVPESRLIPWQVIPETYVCKVSHGSGAVIVVSRYADRSTRLPSPAHEPGWGRYRVHPDTVSRAAVADLCDYWLSLKYGRGRGQSREWAYRRVPPRILIEELCEWQGGLPQELWVHCFNGVPGSILMLERGTSFEEVNRLRLVADDLDEAREPSRLNVHEWQLLLEACRRLSAPTDMVRVDWLITDRGLRFGELTNYPAAGRLTFLNHPTKSPTEVHNVMTSYWSVPRRYE